MATQSAHLVISASLVNIKEATAELNRLAMAGRDAQRATDGFVISTGTLVGSMGKAIPALVSFSTLLAGFNKLKDVTKEFEVLNAQLITIVGSADEAERVFNILLDFAKKTPYQLDETVNAFIKLTNRGLEPTEEALYALGNVAAAQAKPLGQLIEAVADATTGQFRNLKEFGIKASNEGDKIRMDFRGNVEFIDFSTRAIQTYLMRIGQTDFSTAMSEQMKTLKGNLSNLEDEWNKLWFEIGKSGSAGVMKDVVVNLTDAFAELVERFRSGQINEILDATQQRFRVFALNVGESWAIVSETLFSESYTWVQVTKEVFNQILESLRYLPENVRMVMQATGATIAYLPEAAATYANRFYEAITNRLEMLLGYVKAFRSQFTLDVAPDISAQIAAVDAAFDSAESRSKSAADTRIALAKEARDEVIVAALDERDMTIKTFEDRIAAARKMYEDYREEQRKTAENAAGIDRLKGVIPEGGPDPLTFRQERELEKLQEHLMTKQQLELKAYEERKTLLDIALKAEAISQEEYQKLSLESWQNYQWALVELNYLRQESNSRRVQQLLDEIDKENLALNDSLEGRLQILEKQYAKEKQLLDDALAYEKISRETHLAAILRLQKNYEEKREEAMQRERIRNLTNQATLLGMAADMNDRLMSMAQENSRAQKALWVFSKMLAIAQAIVYTELAATRAMSEGGMIAGIPMSTAIRALGYASVGVIAAQSVYEGAQKFEHGGMVPSGSYGIVGEAGPEIVRGPAMVTSARTTSDMMSGKGLGGGGNVQVNIINQTDAQASVEEKDTGDGGRIVDIVIRKVKAELTADVSNGGTPFTSTLERRYGLSRGR